MTVAELVEQLRQFPPDARVAYETDMVCAPVTSIDIHEAGGGKMEVDLR